MKSDNLLSGYYMDHFYLSNLHGYNNFNIEDPVFTRSLERIYNMMNVDQSMPTHASKVTFKINSLAL